MRFPCGSVVVNQAANEKEMEYGLTKSLRSRFPRQVLLLLHLKLGNLVSPMPPSETAAASTRPARFLSGLERQMTAESDAPGR